MASLRSIINQSLEMKQRWIDLAAFLDSGDYKQIRGKLRDSKGGNCFCAGGLMCELSGEGRWEEDSFIVPGLGVMNFTKRYDYTYAIPLSVSRYYGLPDSQQFFLDSNPDQPYSIPCLNDKLMMSFEEIAATIRNHIED